MVYNVIINFDVSRAYQVEAESHDEAYESVREDYSLMPYDVVDERILSVTVDSSE